MNEDFLHYLWLYQQFDKSALKTTEGSEISILKSGFYNTDSGPDFKNALLRIGELEWAGQVEIHLRSSDWYKHKHELDQAYQNVILHVVWEHDKPVIGADQKPIPTLELKDIALKNSWTKYQQLMQSQSQIPCERHFEEVAELKKIGMLGRALMQRLERKSAVVFQKLHQNHGDWEETTYQLLLQNFGFKLNTEAFERLANVVPLKVIRHYQSDSFRIECLLLGAAGLISKYGNQQMQDEYHFLAKKHGLLNNEMNAAEWKFMRTRPANFPTIRISQISALLAHKKSLFQSFITSETAEDLAFIFDQKEKSIGKASVNNLIVNTLVPLLIAYAQYTDDQNFTEKALRLLETIPAEKNRITDYWKSMGLTIGICLIAKEV